MHQKAAVVLGIICICICSLSIQSAIAQDSATQRDAKHHAAQKKENREHTYRGERSFRKFAKTKRELQEFEKNPQGKHVTTQTKGRLPTSDSAQKKYGLTDKPRYVFAGRAENVRVQGKGHDKPTGGERNATEGRIAQKSVDWKKKKITKLDKK